MSRRAAGFVLGIALLLLLAGGLGWWWLGRGRRPGGSVAPAAGPIGPQATFGADLYFPAETGLRAEHRNLVATDFPKERIRKIVQALLAGPAVPTVPGSADGKGGAGGTGGAKGLVRPLPPGVEIGAVELTAEGTAYLDLRWADHDEPPPGGSDAEMQAVYSLVDSVVLNVPEAQRVVLLWNGTQRVSFSGHLDTSRPLLPDRHLIAR